MEAFVPLERRVREFAADVNLVSPAERPEPLGRLVQLLLSRERLDKDLAARISGVARYRNLVVHGQVETVDRHMVDEARFLAELLSRRLRPRQP